jgi:predicted DNA-binding transcriptional regulator YafY
MPKRRADRLFDIIQILRTGGLVTARTLGDRLEVSERTVYRDVADLMASGVPIEGAAGAGYILRPGYELPPLMFDRREITALVLGARMVATWGGTEAEEGARLALAKIETVLTPALRRHVDGTRLYAPDIGPDDGVRARLDLLAGAVDARRIVAGRYVRDDGVAADRRIWPLGLYFWGRVWTLAGWCELRADFRSFRVDRFETLAEAGDPYPDVAGRRLEDCLETVRPRAG